jgi:hypothetical protein
MELGKFTGGRRALSAGSHKTSVSSIILHGASGKQWTEGQTSALRRLALATGMKPRHLTGVLLVRAHSIAGHLLICHLEGSGKALALICRLEGSGKALALICHLEGSLNNLSS